MLSIEHIRWSRQKTADRIGAGMQQHDGKNTPARSEVKPAFSKFFPPDRAFLFLFFLSPRRIFL
ncbi:MAG TPA: hypothetical protein PKW76_07475 [bacterium]|nr:hypothetical protein [bacterium]HPG45502.1 hypothetical protein [bacterium]HPM96722.1 hypothetical protein [bacterium]